jgi:hypothetical protein
MANSHSLQFAAAHTKSSQFAVVTRRCLGTALTVLNSSASVFSGSCPRWLTTASHLPWFQVCLACLPTKLLLAIASTAIRGLHGPNREQRLQQLFYCCVRWVDFHGNVFTEPFPGNGRLSGSVTSPFRRHGIIIIITRICVRLFGTSGRTWIHPEHYA